MIHRYLALPLVLVSSLAVSCGGNDESGSADVEFQGLYAPTDAGDIDIIGFSEDHGYFLMGPTCTSQSCAEVGTYAIEDAGHTLALTSSSTGQKRRLPLQVIETIGGAKSSGTLLTQNLVQPGQELAKPGGEDIVKEGQKLVETVGKALVDSQNVKLVTAGDKQIVTPSQRSILNPECAEGIPTGHTNATDAAAYWAKCPQGPGTPKGG